MKTRTNHGAVIPIGEVNLPRSRKAFGDPLVMFYAGRATSPRSASLDWAVMTTNKEPNPYHTTLEDAGHKLVRDKNGEIDDFQLDVEPGGGRGHSGPRCELCGKAWCIWCEDKPEPCTGAKQ